MGTPLKPAFPAPSQEDTEETQRALLKGSIQLKCSGKWVRYWKHVAGDLEARVSRLLDHERQLTQQLKEKDNSIYSLQKQLEISRANSFPDISGEQDRKIEALKSSFQDKMELKEGSLSIYRKILSEQKEKIASKNVIIEKLKKDLSHEQTYAHDLLEIINGWRSLSNSYRRQLGLCNNYEERNKS